jgi:uncharacterized DUF497 family protein
MSVIFINGGSCVTLIPQCNIRSKSLQIKGLLWLDEIVDKLHYKHNITQQEVKEVFNSKPSFRFVEKGHRSGENVYFATGQTEAGRYLIIFFIQKSDHRALILSARNMTSAEKRQHGRK